MLVRIPDTDSLQERDAFILVLIDGDGMIFEDHLIQRGEAGGKEAAGILWNAVREYVQHNIPGISSDYKIVVRVYANLKGLSDACTRAGILDSPHTMEDFTRGFTGSKQLFDFIDVGSGKDRADDKVSGLFLGTTPSLTILTTKQNCSNSTSTIVIVVI